MISTYENLKKRKSRSICLQTYDYFVDACCSIPELKDQRISILIHGSYAKKDLVAGWSDMDLIVLYQDGSAVKSVNAAIQSLAAACDITTNPVFDSYAGVVKSNKLRDKSHAMLIDALDAGFFLDKSLRIPNITINQVSNHILVKEACQSSEFELTYWNTHIRPDFRRTADRFVLNSAKTVLQLLMYSDSSIWATNRSRDGYLLNYCENQSFSNEDLHVYRLALRVRKHWQQYVLGADSLMAQEVFFEWLSRKVSLRR